MHFRGRDAIKDLQQRERPEMDRLHLIEEGKEKRKSERASEEEGKKCLLGNTTDCQSNSRTGESCAYRNWKTLSQRPLCASIALCAHQSVNSSRFVDSLLRDNTKASIVDSLKKLPSKYVYYYVSPEHKNHYVLSYIFGFDREDDVYHFAYSYPYSYSRLQTYLEEVEKMKLPFLSVDIIGYSLQHRSLSALTIGKGEAGAKQRKTVVITSRVHPGETPASYIVQGLVDYLTSDDSMAQVLREHVTFKVVPMLNPDGVFLGNYRTSMMGFDLNRSWTDANPWAHPTLFATKNLLRQLNGDNTVDLDFFIDIHAHSSLKGSFVYGNQYDDVYRAERHTLFPKLLGQVAEDFNPGASVYNRDPNKNGTARRFFANTLRDKANCYTLEVSFFGYHPRNGSDTSLLVPYTDEGFPQQRADKRLGRNLARAFFQYYVVTNHIPAAESAAQSSVNRGRSRDRSR
uniref:Peptidase M14 domain-containing protein n=1 Tax=Strigamia maritima TaxID=126957 RepID=T1JBE5_STRMM